MWSKLVDTISSLDNVMIRSISEDIMLSAGLSEAFRRSPAATGMHHAFIGGLLEHTWQMVESAEALLALPYYREELNRDLCLFGILFHDFGKIFEYAPDTFKQTAQGRLVSHIPMVAAMIYHECQKQDVPEVVRDHLMHVVLAHHRKLEWGSPVQPATPEAMFVHFIDNLHGDVFGAVQKIESDGGPGVDFVRRGYNEPLVLVDRFDSVLGRLAEYTPEGF
jgi:3'-5' exoribonuclease